jgi:uncharacterized protein YegP (UPF0339 family)
MKMVSQQRYNIQHAEFDLYFNLKDANGKIILNSPMYHFIKALEHCISVVRKLAMRKDRFRQIRAKNRKLLFQLIGANGQIMATNKMHPNKNSMAEAMFLVKQIHTALTHCLHLKPLGGIS